MPTRMVSLRQVSLRLVFASGLCVWGMGCPVAPATDGGVLDDAGEVADGGQDPGPQEACPVEGYSACGGDLSGEWRFVALCPDPADESPCQSPFDSEPACVGDGNTVSCALDVSGSLDFGADSVHVTQTTAVAPTYTFTEACLAAVRPDDGDTAEARCAAVANPPRLICEWTGSACVCEGRTGEELTDESVPFSTDGAAITIGEFEGTFCADGDTLTLDFDPHPLSWRYWVLDRP